MRRSSTVRPCVCAAAWVGTLLAACGAPPPGATARTRPPAVGSATMETVGTAASGQPRAPVVACAPEDLVGCARGCDAHVADDCAALADLYDADTPDRPADKGRALALYRRACDGNSARGCMGVGRAAKDGGAVGVDEAVAAYLRACDAGANQGCVAAGRAHLESDDATRAARLFARVCARGNGEACFELGKLHEQGRGVDASRRGAFDLFARGCGLGFEPACTWASRTEPVRSPRE